MSEQRLLSGATTNYTEEDTFRVLARPDVHVMFNLHREWKRKLAEDGTDFNSMWNISFMKYHGWTWVEFLRAKNDAGYSY